MAVVQYFNTNQLLFPTRFWGGTKDGELTWQALSHGRMLAILHNPAYAGAYVYGKTQTRTKSLPGEAPRVKGRTRQVNGRYRRHGYLPGPLHQQTGGNCFVITSYSIHYTKLYDQKL